VGFAIYSGVESNLNHNERIIAEAKAATEAAGSAFNDVVDRGGSTDETDKVGRQAGELVRKRFEEEDQSSGKTIMVMSGLAFAIGALLVLAAPKPVTTSAGNST